MDFSEVVSHINKNTLDIFGLFIKMKVAQLAITYCKYMQEIYN